MQLLGILICFLYALMILLHKQKVRNQLTDYNLVRLKVNGYKYKEPGLTAKGFPQTKRLH